MDNNNEKKFGTSVFKMVPEADKEVIESKFFKDKENEFNKEEIEAMRKDMKDNENPRVKAAVTKDALSGIISSKPFPFDDEDEKTHEEIDKMLKENDIEGKTISRYGKSLIKTTMNREATEEECKYIAEKFEEHKKYLEVAAYENSEDDAKKKPLGYLSTAIAIDKVEDILPEAIREQVKAIAGDSYDSILRRFVYQLFFAYDSTTSVKDHINELNQLSRAIKSHVVSDSDITDDEKYDSMEAMTEYIQKFMNVSMSLDRRNSMMKQDYTIDDIDICAVKEIKECLDTAIDFRLVKEKTDRIISKLKKDIKHVDDINRSIENWIGDIKNDSKVLYTFPCNDFLTAEQSRVELCRVFVNAYLAHMVMTNNIEVPNDRMDLLEYLLEIKFITEDAITNLNNKALWFLYVLTRTFKYNRIKEDNNSVRILSYTLDIISKLGMKDHLNRFVDVSDYIFNKITN